MLKKSSEIKWKSIGNKEYMIDDLIDKMFIMEHNECSESKAIVLIREINKSCGMKYKKDYTVFGRGRTSLKWYWEYFGLSGEFI
ncbi:hypothetical protein [Streptobacillus moniliformis]|uniref:hypothetical protein n=1 Tax=Streptobacillus moniliformis TaxID=34105 RepID=UPI0007E3BA43|nr:hypothetical protein [Streptobacillus moniliformis]